MPTWAGTACNFPAVRVAGNDACSINIKDRREPGGNCWRKGAKSSPSSSADKITAKAASMSIAEKDMARPKGCYRTPGRREKATSSRDSCRHDGSLMSMRTHVCYTTSSTLKCIPHHDSGDRSGISNTSRKNNSHSNDDPHNIPKTHLCGNSGRDARNYHNRMTNLTLSAVLRMTHCHRGARKVFAQARRVLLEPLQAVGSDRSFSVWLFALQNSSRTKLALLLGSLSLAGTF